MLTIATIVKESEIHGHGCFAGEEVPAGTVVWVLDEVDERIEDVLRLKIWEHHHAYRSHMAEKLWILPRDNAAWINFADSRIGEFGEPNLREGELVNEEPSLVATRNIAAGEELTVGPETDGDAYWKIAGNYVDTPNL